MKMNETEASDKINEIKRGMAEAEISARITQLKRSIIDLEYEMKKREDALAKLQQEIADLSCPFVVGDRIMVREPLDRDKEYIVCKITYTNSHWNKKSGTMCQLHGHPLKKDGNPSEKVQEIRKWSDTIIEKSYPKSVL